MFPAHAREKNMFKPGQSGNPNGRPKGALGLKKLIQKVWDDEITDDQGCKTTRGLLLVKSMFDKAQGGDVAAFKALCERMEGPVNMAPDQVINVVQMPSVQIDGKELELDVGEPPPELDV